MKVFGHRIKDYYSAIHTPLYSEEKNAFEILEEKFKCTRVYVYYFEERPECMSAIDGFDNNGDAYIFHVDVCYSDQQTSSIYLQFADELNAKVRNGAETRFDMGYFADDELVGVKLMLSIFVFKHC